MRTARLMMLLSMIGALALSKGASSGGSASAKADPALQEASRLQAVADSLYAKGEYDGALGSAERALAIREKVLGPDHRDLVPTLNRIAILYKDQGRYTDAGPFFQRMLKIQETVLGPVHVDVANSMNMLANMYRSEGRDADAEPLFKRALEIREKVLGPEDLDVAASLNNLAVHYMDQARYAEAEPLYQRAIKVLEKAVGPEHVYVGTTLENLAILYLHQGRYAEAEPLYLRAIEILEKGLGPQHEDVGRSLESLATLYEAQGRYAEAEPLYQRGLKIRERLGPEHPDFGKSLYNLANIYRDQGRYAEAEPLFQRSLKILENALGAEHPDIGGALGSLANLYEAQGRYAEAEPLYQRALKILEKSLGPEHPDLAVSLVDFASCQEAMGRSREAMTSLAHAMRIEQANMGRLFAVSSEPVMRDYMAKVNSSLDRLLSLAREGAMGHPEEADSAFEWTLRRKGMILETLVRFREAQRLLSEDPAVARQAEDLSSLRERLNRLETGPPSKGNPAAGDSQVVDIRKQCDDLEAQLNRRVSERLPRGISQDVDLRAVRGALPLGSALAEFTRVRLFDFRATGAGPQRMAPHYLAFVLASGQNTPSPMVDLGDADEIDKQVQQVRESLQLGYASRAIGGLAPSVGAGRREPRHERNPEDLFRSRSEALYRRVFAPLRKAMGAARTIYVAPDGDLNRIPYEALVDGQGNYLIEKYRFAYLTSGRELLEPATRAANGTVVFAAPDYDLGVRERKAHAGMLLASTPSPAALEFRGYRSTEARTWAGWHPLPGTTREATEVRRELDGSAYGPVRVYAGKDALEEVLKTLPAPRVLHIATHGYFFPDQKLPQKDTERFLTEEDPFDSEQRLSRIRGTENPLLRSGIVLAGANAAGAEGDSLGVEDGWVTAEEIGMMNLRGTELVVLSACETGLADVRLGEGVSGLRRAFRYAGARTLVMSLFQVDDEATQVLMGRFYRGLKEGRGKLEALREAQLQVMRERRQRTGSAHPFYWASFVLVGDPN